MTSIVSNTFSFFTSFSPSAPCPRIQSMHIRSLGSVGSAFLHPPGMQMPMHTQTQTQLQCKANLASLLPFCWVF